MTKRCEICELNQNLCREKTMCKNNNFLVIKTRLKWINLFMYKIIVMDIEKSFVEPNSHDSSKSESFFEHEYDFIYDQMFQKVFENYSLQYKQLLMDLGMWKEGNIRENFKHALQYRIYSEEDTEFLNVMMLISQANRTESRQLIIEDKILKVIPFNIELCKHLRKLCLSELDISILPSSMKNLTKLEELIITKCPIKQIPGWVGLFKSLSYLRIERCNITSLPETIGELNNLTHLSLCYNNPGIKSLTNALSGMKLHTLLLDGNPLSSIPDGFSKLRKLSINQTKITSLNPMLLHQLEYLTWNDSGVKDFVIKSHIKNNLQHLQMSSNKMVIFPDLSRCVHLQYVNLKNNPITVFNKNYLPPSKTCILLV